MNIFFHVSLTNRELPSLACSFSHFSHVWLFSTIRTVACQAPLSMGFSRQEYWNGLPCPPPGDLPDQGIKPMSIYVSCIDRQVVFCFVLFFFFVNLVNWRLITLQYCSGFCHTFTWISHGCTCVPHSEPPPTSLPIPSLRVIPLHQPWAPCLMHWTWTGHLFHIWQYTCFSAILSNHPTFTFSHRVQKSVLYICVSFATFNSCWNVLYCTMTVSFIFIYMLDAY